MTPDRQYQYRLATVVADGLITGHTWISYGGWRIHSVLNRGHDNLLVLLERAL